MERVGGEGRRWKGRRRYGGIRGDMDDEGGRKMRGILTLYLDGYKRGQGMLGEVGRIDIGCTIL